MAAQRARPCPSRSSSVLDFGWRSLLLSAARRRPTSGSHGTSPSLPCLALPVAHTARDRGQLVPRICFRMMGVSVPHTGAWSGSITAIARLAGSLVARFEFESYQR